MAEDGAFSTPLELTAGKWAITVTASSAEGKTQALTRNVSVTYKGVNLVVSIKGGRAWLKVWVDGKIDDQLGVAGSVVGNGKTLTFTGDESVEVRTGFVRRHVLHAQRDIARRAGPVRDARDVAVRTSGATGEDPAALTVADVADERLDGSRGATPGRVPGARDCTSPPSSRAPAASSATRSRPSPDPAATTWVASITYADDVKRDLAGVPADVLAAHGAVSAQVAIAMADGSGRGSARTSRCR